MTRLVYLNQKPELSDLCEHVRTLNWYQLGLQLEIDSIYLDEIMYDNKSEDMKRMKMFEVWLRTNPKASVGQLVEALRRKSIQENAIADEFEQIYKPHDTAHFLNAARESMELTSIKLPLPKLLVETQKKLSATPKHQSYSNIMAVSEDSTEVQVNDQQSVDNFSLATESSKNTIELLPQPAIMQSSGHSDEKTGMVTTKNALETKSYLYEKPDIVDLNEHVRTVKWYQLGIQLKLDTVLLAEINNTNQPEDVKRSKMFAVWLKESEASVKQLLEALRLKSVGENTIADELERKYESHLLRGRKDLKPTNESMDITEMKQNTNSEVPKRLAVTIDEQSSSKVMAVSKDTINNLCFDSLAEEEKFSLLVKVTGMYHDTIVQPVPLFVDIHEQGMELQPSTCYLTTTVVRKRKLPVDSNITKTKGKLYDLRKHEFSGMGQAKIDFCFSEPDTEYNNTIKIHSIIDANGEEITDFRCESDTCSVLTSDTQTYHPAPRRDLPPIQFTAPLIGERFLKLCDTFSKLTTNPVVIAKFIKDMTKSTHIPCDIKAYSYISLGCAYQHLENRPYHKALKAFSHARVLSQKAECRNGCLLEGMVFVYTSNVNRIFGKFEEARQNIEKARAILFYISPCNETAMVHFQDAMLLYLDQVGILKVEAKEEVLSRLEMAVEHVRRGTDYRTISHFAINITKKALVHLNINPSCLENNEYTEIDSPELTTEDLAKAKASLDAVPEAFLEKPEPSQYKAMYYFALFEYHRLNGEDEVARQKLKLAKKQVNLANIYFNEELIETKLSKLSDTQDHSGSDTEWDDLVDAYSFN